MVSWAGEIVAVARMAVVGVNMRYSFLLLPCCFTATVSSCFDLNGFHSFQLRIIHHTHKKKKKKGSKALKKPQHCKELTMMGGEVGGDGHRRALKQG